METNSWNAWHRFETTGKVEDYLRYCAASEPAVSAAGGAAPGMEDDHAAQIKGARPEVPPHRGKR